MLDASMACLALFTSYTTRNDQSEREKASFWVKGGVKYFE